MLPWRAEARCLLRTHTSSCLPITSMILEELIIEMHYKTYDWPKWIINSILLLSYAALFLQIADARMHPLLGSESPASSSVIIQCRVCIQDGLFGRNMSQQLAATFSLSQPLFLSPSISNNPHTCKAGH